MAVLLGGGRGRSIEAPYAAASESALIPFVPDIGPIDTVVYQRRLMWLARHLYKNDPWVKALVDTWTSYVVGTGPVPRSRHNQLADLFMASAAKFDMEGYGWGTMWREHIAKNKFIDGEVFLKFGYDEDEDDGFLVPTRVQVLTSDYCPPELIRAEQEDGGFTVAGIQFKVGPDGRRTSKRQGYWFYPVHPRDVYANPTVRWFPEFTPANEVAHLRKAPTGSPRAEVPIAAAIVRALKLATYEDAELRRKISATFLSLFIERPLDGVNDESALQPSVDDIDELIGAIQMQPGGVWELPAGYKANLQSPPDSPANLLASVRWHLFAICASVRVPAHLVTGNHDGLSDRTERLAGLDFKRTIECERQDLEDQGYNPCWDNFVDGALASGRFVLPTRTPVFELYQVDWDQPIIQLNNLSTDINAFAQGIAAGIIDPSYATQNLFGVRHEVVTRRLAEAEARRQAVGFENLTPPAGSPPADPAAAARGSLGARDGSGANPAPGGGAGTTAPATGGPAGSQQAPRWNPAATPVSQSIYDKVLAEEQAERDLIDGAYVADAMLDQYEPAVEA